MASYTSSQTGNWNLTSTWGGGGYPISGDTAIISSGHIVTVTANAVVGTGGVAGTDELTINGSLVINEDIRLTVRGDTRINDGASLTLGAGSEWFVDDGDYEFEFNGISSMTVNGTSGNRTFFGADTGNHTWIDDAGNLCVLNIDASFCDFYLGGGSDYGFDFHGAGNIQSIVFTNCKMTLPTRCDYANGAAPSASSVFKFINCDFRGLPESTALVCGDGDLFDFTTANSHGFWGCTFEGNLSSAHSTGNTLRTGLGSNKWVLNDCVSREINWYCASPINADYVSTSMNSDPDTGMVALRLQCNATGSNTIDNCVVRHIHQGIRTYFTNAFSVAVQDSYFECEGNTSGIHVIPVEAGNDATVMRCIGIGCQFCYARYDNATSSLLLERNTSILSNLYTVSGEEYTGTDTLRSNIEYAIDPDSQNGFLIHGTGAPATDITYTDYNCVYNKTFANRYADTTVSGKVLGDVGFGGSDIGADPQFADASGTIVTWDTSLGGAGTSANAFDEMQKRNGFDKDGTAVVFDSAYTTADLLTYIRAAYTPTNGALKGAGYGGEDIGAQDIDSAKSLSCTMWIPGF